MQYIIVHTVRSAESEREDIKLAAARALYAELIKYYNSVSTKKSA